jgi:hypothetical protein
LRHMPEQWTTAVSSEQRALSVEQRALSCELTEQLSSVEQPSL